MLREIASDSRIARSLTPRRVLPIALLFSIADLALTEALLGLAVEKNPLASWLFESVGVGVTGAVAVGIVTFAYVGLDALDQYGRAQRVVSGGLLGVMIAPVVWNLGIWMRLGVPSVALGGVVEVIAPVLGATLVALAAVTVEVDTVPRPDRDAVVSIALSVLMVTSMVGGVAFVGTQPFGDSEGEGVAKAQSDGGDVVYSGSDDGTVKALDTDTGDEIWSSGTHSSRVSAVSESPDGEVVYSGGAGGTVKALDASTGGEIWSSSAHSDGIESMSLSPSGGIIYSGSSDNTVKALDAETGNETWSHNTNSQDADSVSASPDGEVVYAGMQYQNVKALDAETGETIWDNDLGSSYVYGTSPSPDGSSVYVGVGDGEVKSLDANTGDVLWSVSVGSSRVNSVSASPNGEVVYSGGYPSVKALDAETGDEIWSNSPHTEDIASVSTSPGGEVVYTGSVDNTVKALDTETGDEIWSSSAHSDSVNSLSAGGTASSNGPFSDWENTAPLIRAVDQNGDPVPNATIEAWSVDAERISDEYENKEARAEEILDELDDVEPDEWEPPAQVDIAAGDLTDLYDDSQPEGVYPTAHTKGDMGIAGWADTHNLQPRLEFESGETVYLYAWDGGAGANMGLTDDGVTSEHYGEIADEPTFRLQRLDPTGETLDNHTVEATETYSGGIPPLSYEHDYATADVPDGFYRVSVEESDAPGYVIKVGEATKVLSTEMENEADQLTKQAEQLENYLGEDTAMRDRVVAAYDLRRRSHELADVPVDMSAFDYGVGYVNPGLNVGGADAETERERQFPEVTGNEILLQGYRGPTIIEDYEDRNVSDIMEEASKVDDPIYASKKPKRVDMTEIDDPTNTTIEVTLQKFDTGLNPNVSEHANKTKQLTNELLNKSTAELESLFRENPELLNGTELEARHEELQNLTEANSDLEERVEELRDAESVEDAGNATEEQLKEDLAAMEQALAEVEGQLEAEDPTSAIDSEGEIFAEFPFAEELNPEAVTVVANYEDGSSEVVPDEYVSVESAGVLGGDQVGVSGFELPDDRAVADLEVKGVSTEGALGTSRDSVTNPAYQGEIPELDAIDVSTLRPGVGESVAVEPRSSAEGYGGAERATVYGPDGQTLNVTQNDERFTWAPERTGTHTVRLTYSNDIGGEFTETFRLAAEENPASNPPTVRVTDGIGGNLLLAGNGLESGSLSVTGANAEIVAQAPADQSPSALDIHAEQLAVDSMDVSVVIGDEQRSVDRHVSLRVWANFGVEDALVLRGPSEPITADAETPFGAFETRTSESGGEHQVVETYTDAGGTTSVEVNRDPSLLDRASYQIAIWGIDLPFAILPTSPTTTLPAAVATPPAADEAVVVG